MNDSRLPNSNRRDAADKRQSVQRLLEIQPGFHAEGVKPQVCTFPKPAVRKGRRAQFYERSLARLTQLPGVGSAAACSVNRKRYLHPRVHLFADFVCLRR
jgi:hypothetical protein